MVTKTQYPYAISLPEMAYKLGAGRAAIVILSVIQVFNFLFNAAIYLCLLRGIL
jgi:hypothetical protein